MVRGIRSRPDKSLRTAATTWIRVIVSRANVARTGYSKDSLYQVQGLETLVICIAIVGGVQAQVQFFKFQPGRVRDISRESGLREETPQATKGTPAHFCPSQINSDGAWFADSF